MKRTTMLAIAGAILLGPLITTPLAASETNVSSGLTLQGPGLAVHGYDTVSFFTEGEPAIGLAEHSMVHAGATYRFANKANLAAFEKDPARYAPQYGGFCAYGVAVGAKFDGDPQHWRIVDGKLYLNLNSEIQATWAKDIAGNVSKADESWKKIASKSPAELK